VRVTAGEGAASFNAALDLRAGVRPLVQPQPEPHYSNVARLPGLQSAGAGYGIQGGSARRILQALRPFMGGRQISLGLN
jgi:hypothetical protein